LTEKKKERDNKIAVENNVLQETLARLSDDIMAEEATVQGLIKNIQIHKSEALEHEGADTVRLNAIEKELIAINEELKYIESNRQTVSEYSKDKRELFDLVDKFKSDKKIYESQLTSERQRHELAKSKLQESVIKLKNIIGDLDTSQRQIDEDLLAFDNFTQTEVFSKLAPASLIISESAKTAKRLIALRDEINDKTFSINGRLNDLRAAVQKFLSNFSSENIFGFKTNPIEDNDFFRFAAAEKVRFTKG